MALCGGLTRRGLVALTLLGVGASAARAQKPVFTDSLLDRMVGQWVLSGTIDGQQTTHDVAVDWVLNHGYIRLHEVSREKDAAGAPAYEAIVFIGADPSGKGLACEWLDSTGGTGLNGRAIAHADPAGDRIPFLFTFPDGTTFHTTFVYDRPTGRWQWLMDAEAKDGKLTPFARVTLTRASS